MTIQIARDSRTGYPVFRQMDKDPNRAFGNYWVSLLPVTKYQVEQWIVDGGMTHSEPSEVTDLTERFEMTCDCSAYPDTIKSLRRISLAKCTRENLHAILATHLSTWTSADDLRRSDITFPTKKSEWGRIANWLHGVVPSTKEWKLTLDSYSKVKTKELMRGVLAQRIPWNPTAQSLLHKLLELFSEEEMGLPFMGLGVYELTNESRKFDKLTTNPPETAFRRLAAGESRLWPTLDNTGHYSWRPMLQSVMPVVGLRLWFPETHVTDSLENGQPRLFEVPLTTSTRPVASAHSAADWDRRVGSLNGYCRARITMEDRCPVCYQRVDKSSFQNWPVIWCYQEQVADKDGNLAPVRKHSESPPTGAIVSMQAISQDYLEVARNSVEEIRSVTLSGASQAGKGMFLLSLIGLMNFPLGRSRFLKAFHESGLKRTDCSMFHPVSAREHENALRQMEDLWADGYVPTRTSKLREALRCPVLFQCHRGGFLGVKSKRRLIVILNDIAGEIVDNPVELPTNDNFPHLMSTTDVIFLVPAPMIRQGAAKLNLFANGLGAVKFEGRAVDRKQINLILAVSQIDKLKYGDDSRLLDVFFRRPYNLPFEPRPSDTEAYFAGMSDVHHDLEGWLRRNVPDLVDATHRFASVRYCGFSSVGSELIHRMVKPGSEFCLPFAPQPFRVVDPLFWLLRDNGLLSF